MLVFLFVRKTWIGTRYASEVALALIAHAKVRSANPHQSGVVNLRGANSIKSQPRRVSTSHSVLTLR